MDRQKGFTLVEAAVAIGVVAILSGIIIPLVLKSIRDSREARARNDINVIVGAIASQLKDMGVRPSAPNGPGGATGVGDALWFSEGEQPILAGPGGGPWAAGIGNQTFVNLFTAPSPAIGAAAALTEVQANALFGLPAPAAGAAPDEIRYQGHYLTRQAAITTDPWGRAYLIVGYNQEGQAARGPIWVVSAGAAKSINTANLFPVPPVVAVAGAPLPQAPAVWDYTNGSETNIAVQVH